MEITITLPDGKQIKAEKGASALDAISLISKRLAKDSIAAKVDGKAVDLSHTLESDCSLTALTFDSAEGKEVFWHSSAHILAQAVMRLYPDARPTIGPAVENGFYYDFADVPAFTPSDLAKIEAEMKKIAQEDQKFSRKKVSRADAEKLYLNNPFKLEMIAGLQDDEITIYENAGGWSDLCRGPHIPTSGVLKGIKLTKLSSAYWKADAKNAPLQRIYGITYPSQKQLDEYLNMLAEAEKRDHRKLGVQLGLFAFHEWSPGSAFFLPHGTIIYNELLALLREEYIKRGYHEVVTPQLYNKALWESSGHWQHYQENMFILDIDGEQHSLKPMNCPSHVLMYKMNSHSYRELPLRIADFCALHRNELKGVLGGMTRVRKFEQDDAHIFCTSEQIGQEIDGMLDLVDFIYSKTFKFKYSIKLSTRPDNFMGEEALWEEATGKLRAALDSHKLPYVIKEGEGAFYGPKIDIDVTDALGRQWQLATIQLDFQMPLRMGAEYEGQDGRKHTPVMMHRAILGSMERFIAILVEHYAGAFPVWLSPVQVAILPLADEYNLFAKELQAKFAGANIRCSINDKAETIGSKIRDAQLAKIPYMLVVGKKEKESGNLAIRTRKGEILNDVPAAQFISTVSREIAERIS
jgi:threonyl-tRNA synthetase